MEKLKDDLIEPKDHRQHIQHSSGSRHQGKWEKCLQKIVKIAANNSKKNGTLDTIGKNVHGAWLMPSMGTAGQAA